MREGMNEAAMEKFRKALKQNPNLQVAHSSVAVLYEGLGENELAEKHYRKAYSLNRKDSPTLNNYAQILCRDGRLKEADRMFAEAVRNTVSSYTLILKNQSPESDEPQALLERERKLGGR